MMSFVRVAKGGHGATGITRKKKSMKKKAWDDTVNDLTAYKATPEEIEYRKASHRSKHALSSRLIKHPGSAHKGKRGSPFKSNAQARKLAIMKEVLYDQQQLQNVLEKSDTMMAVVKDLFGDDPRRFAGFPKVTSAPNMDKQDVTTSLASKPPPIQTRSEFLSDSMMDSSALNDLQESDSEEESTHIPVSYQPKMNLQRFQDFLEKEEQRNNNTLSTISGQAGLSHLGPGTFSQMMGGAVQSSQLPDLSQGDAPPGTPEKKDLDESVAILRPPGSAINDTKKVKKTKPRVQQPQPEQNTSSFSLPDLKKVLENLEEEIIEYERQTGRRPMAERNRQESFSGYTLAIVDSVTKLTRYLKECELRLQAEMTVREQLAQDVMQFRALVDALTSDIITTQEEFGKMASEFVKFKRETQAEIQRLKSGNAEPEADLHEEPATVTPPRSQQLSFQQQSLQLQQQQEQHAHHLQQKQQPKNQQQNLLHEPDHETPREFPRELNPFGDHLRPVPAAVMLSPPVRRSRVMEPERDLNPNPYQQGSLLKDLVSGDESTNSTILDDYRGLPSSSQPTVSYDASSRPSGIPQQIPGAQNLPGQPTRLPVSKPPLPTQTVRPAVPAPLNTVSVPRPTPLVQTNVNIPISAGANVGRDVNQSVPLRSHDQSHDPLSMVPSSDRAFLASQIAELNKQHEDAQKRLESLMQLQKNKEPQSQPSQQSTQQQREPDLSQQTQSQVNQSQTGSQQQNIELQQLQQLQQRQQQLQKQQQLKLLEMVQQQQQRIIEQQQQQALLQQQQQQKPQSNFQQTGIQSQEPMRQSVDVQQRTQHSQVPQTGSQSGIPKPVFSGQEAVRQSTDIPGYRPQQKQTGLPGYLVSPNISPISQRSDKYVYQSIDSQNGSLMIPASRGITVSIPMVDMDLSGGSPSPKPVEIAR